MGAGRFFCVALPLILLIGSIGTLLYSVLAGLAHENTYIFRIDLGEMSIDPSKVDEIAKALNIAKGTDVENITARELGLDKLYDFTLWGFCSTDNNNHRNCSKGEFDWADKMINVTDLKTDKATIEMPKDIKAALETFQKLTKWAQVAFIVALVALGIQLVIGILSNFSRIISCLTWLESLLSTLFVFIACGLTTALAAVVVGVAKTTHKLYGVDGSINGKFLAVIWIGAACALGASLFWIFTICCCKPEHRKTSRRNKHTDDGEKLIPGGGFGSRGYAPLGNDHEMQTGYVSSAPTAPRFASGSGRSDLAYEPFSHRA